MQDALTASIELLAIASALFFSARFVALVATPGRPSHRKAPIAPPTAPLSCSQAVLLDDEQLIQPTHTPYLAPESAPDTSDTLTTAPDTDTLYTLPQSSQLTPALNVVANAPIASKTVPKTRKKALSVVEPTPLKTISLRGKKYVPIAELAEVPEGIKIYSVRKVQAVLLDKLQK